MYYKQSGFAACKRVCGRAPLNKAASPLPVGEAEEVEAGFIPAVTAGLGAEPH